MPITQEESAGIIEAINQGTPLNEIEAFKPIADKVVVYTPEGLDKFKSNVLESELEKTIGGRVKEIYDNIDADLDKVGFVKLNPEEKTYDRIKRFAGEYNTSKEKYKSEIDALKSQIEGGEGLEAIKKEYEGKIIAFKEKEGKYQEQMNGLQQQMIDYKKGTIINGKVAEYRKQFKEGLPESIVNTHVETVINRMIQSTKLSEDGKTLQVLESDGSVKKNPANYEPVTLDFELKTMLGDLIDPGRNQGGAGGGEGKPKQDPKQVNTEDLTIPEAITTQVQLDEYLQKELNLKGEDFFKASKKYGRDKNLPLH